MDVRVNLRWLTAALIFALGCGGKGPPPDAVVETTVEESPGTDTKAPPPVSVVPEPPREPATVEAAAKLLDLRKFTLPDGAKPMGRPTLGSLMYEVKDDMKSAFDFASKGLLAAGWKQMPDARIQDTYAMASFTREGFVTTLSAYPSGQGGMSQVSIHNAGNVHAGRLPVPADMKMEYQFPQTAGYATKPAKIPPVADAIQKLFIEKGWQPYGGHAYDTKISAGQSMAFKRNAILVSVSVITHENRPGETMVQYGTKLLSADLPAPANVAANDLRYSDEERTLTFDTQDGVDNVGKFYKEALAKQDWQPTTDPKGLTDMLLIFRNPAKDMIMLDVMGKKKPTHVKVRYYTAAECAEFDKKAEEKKK